MKLWHPIVPVLAVATSLRAAYLIVLWNDPSFLHPVSDPAYYLELGRQLFHGGGDDSRLLFCSPLYPYVVALLQTPRAIAIVQAAGGLLSMTLLYTLGSWLVERYAWPRQVPIVAAWLYALSGPPLMFEMQVYPTSLTITALLAALYFQRRTLEIEQRTASYYAFAAGLAASCALFLSPALLLFPVVLTLLLPYRRPALLIHYLVPLLLMLTLFSIRNSGMAGSLSPFGSNAGVTYGQGNQPHGNGLYRNLAGFDGSKDRQHRQARRIAEQHAGRSLSWSAVDRYFLRTSLSEQLHKPVATFVLLTHKLAHFFGNPFPSQGIAWRIERRRQPLLAALPITFPFLFLLALVPWVWRGRSPSLILLPPPVSAVVLPPLICCLIFYVSQRYRLPAWPALCLAGGYGVAFLHTQVSKRQLGWAALAIVAVAFGFSSSPPSNEEVDLAAYHKGLSLEEAGQAEAARDEWQRLYQRRPSVLVGHSIVRSAIEQRRYDRAESDLKEIMKRFPDQPTLLNDLAVIAMRRRQHRQALDPLGKATEHKNPPAEVYKNLALSLVALEEYEQAIYWFESYHRLRRDDWRSQYQLANTLLTLKKYGMAETAIQRTLSATQQAHNVRYAKGMSLLLAGLIAEKRQRWSEAETRYLSAEEILTDSPLPPANLALLAQRRGQRKKANSFAEIALRRGAPASAFPWYSRSTN